MSSSSSYSLESFDSTDSTDLASSILNEIKQGLYVCLVCTEELDEYSQVWSCGNCFRVYDLDCIQDWAKRDSKPSGSWRCPSCKDASTEIPKLYTCWCKKVISPARNPFSPHSCGQTCSAPMQSCPHNCTFSCHPGPHSTVCQILPQIQCLCGAQKRQFPCAVAPYEESWHCDTVCTEIMPCGKHEHQQQCHSGLCGKCKTLIDSTCYCGASKKPIECGSRVEVACASDSSQWIGSFMCDKPCNQVLDCGNESHRCPIEYCHPRTEKYSHKCSLSPDIITTCPCGKSRVDSLLASPRTSCSDPVPTCDNVCGKTLSCGHKCYWKCHSGSEHAPCFRTVDMKCLCGFNTFSVPCASKSSGLKPKCTRKCQTLKNCRRHRCDVVCCPDAQTALKRDHDRRKNIYVSVSNLSTENLASLSRHDETNMSIEAIHICTEPCNRLLNCQKHRCTWQDHPGKCPPCLESSFNDLVCPCGKTVLIEAPVRCGAVPAVSCKHPCNRPRNCGHTAPHPCHDDSVPCAVCTEFVLKKCACGAATIKGVYCYQESVSCGAKCHKFLSCGLHECDKVCCPASKDHSLISCTSRCGKPRVCGHSHTAPCHGKTDCELSSPCAAKIKVYCPCKHRSKVELCGATSEIKQHELECDGECMRIMRNQQLLQAFHLGESSFESPYSDYLLDVFAKQKLWCEKVEKTFKSLVRAWKVNPKTANTTFHFPPMKRPQRTFIHHLSDCYGLFSQSQDREPKRSVMVKVTPDSKLPTIMLWEAALARSSIDSSASASTAASFASSTMNTESSKDSASKININGIKIYKCALGCTASHIQAIVESIAPKLGLGQAFVSSLSYRGMGSMFIIIPENFTTINGDTETSIKITCHGINELIGASDVMFEAVSTCFVSADGMPVDESNFGAREKYGEKEEKRSEIKENGESKIENEESEEKNGENNQKEDKEQPNWV